MTNADISLILTCDVTNRFWYNKVKKIILQSQEYINIYLISGRKIICFLLFLGFIPQNYLEHLFHFSTEKLKIKAFLTNHVLNSVFKCQKTFFCLSTLKGNKVFDTKPGRLKFNLCGVLYIHNYDIYAQMKPSIE